MPSATVWKLKVPSGRANVVTLLPSMPLNATTTSAGRCIPSANVHGKIYMGSALRKILIYCLEESKSIRVVLPGRMRLPATDLELPDAALAETLGQTAANMTMAISLLIVFNLFL